MGDGHGRVGVGVFGVGVHVLGLDQVLGAGRVSRGQGRTGRRTRTRSRSPSEAATQRFLEADAEEG